MNIQNYSWLAGLILCVSNAAAATSPVTNAQLLKQLDFDKDGRLNKQEVQAGLSHKIKMAKTKDGTAADDAESYLAGLIKKGNPSEDDIVGDDEPMLALLYDLLLHEKDLKNTPPFQLQAFDAKRDFFLEEVYDRLPTKKELETMPYKPAKPVFSLRRDKDETDMPSPGDVADQTKGALLSYSKDFEGDTDQWSFRGALLYSFVEKANPSFVGEPPAFYKKSWNAFTALDKVSTGNGDADEVDSLDFGFTRHLVYLAPSGKWNYDLAFGATFNTDTDFDHQTYKGVFDFAPVVPRLGMAGNSDFNMPNFPFFIYWTLNIHGEAGEVGDAGDNKKLLEEGYARLGGKATVHITPKFFEGRLLLEASYLHYQTIASDMDSPSYFEAEARYRLTDFRSRVPAYLVANYRKGTLEDTLEEDDRLMLGFSVAF